MTISKSEWSNYIARLRKLNETAAGKMQKFVDINGIEDREALINYAYALVTKYGEGSAELACQMYDAVAELEGKIVEAAIPAATATYQETAIAINGSLLQSPTGQKLAQVANRLVKQAGQDTTLQNAVRDGAYFAWVPAGDTCAFCLTLASNGFQRISKKALKRGHAEHIHANCDCAYTVSFSEDAKVGGYNPEALREQYYSHEGTPREKINALRRENYAKNKDKINAQKRLAYKLRNGERVETDVPQIVQDSIDLTSLRDDVNIIIHPDKLNLYLLKPGAKHYPEFTDVGYSEGDAERLFADIANGFKNNKAYQIEQTPEYKSFCINMELGLTKRKNFKTVWRQEKGVPKPRLITAYRVSEDD